MTIMSHSTEHHHDKHHTLLMVFLLSTRRGRRLSSVLLPLVPQHHLSLDLEKENVSSFNPFVSQTGLQNGAGYTAWSFLNFTNTLQKGLDLPFQSMHALGLLASLTRDLIWALFASFLSTKTGFLFTSRGAIHEPIPFYASRNWIMGLGRVAVGGWRGTRIFKNSPTDLFAFIFSSFFFLFLLFWSFFYHLGPCEQEGEASLEAVQTG